MVVANSSAGSGDRARLGQAVSVLAEHAPTEIVWCGDPSDVAPALDRLGERRLCIAGGDGSLHTVVNALVDRTPSGPPPPVAVVPAGTGNDTARGLGLPLDPVEAGRVAATGRPQQRPLLDVAGHGIGVNNLHLGIGVAAAERGTAWKPRLGRLAYPAGTMVEGFRHQGASVSVTVDGEPCHDGPALAVLVALGPSAGGGAEVVAGIDPADDHLDVVVVGAVARRRRLGLAVAATRGRLDRHGDVVRRQGAAVHVELARPGTYEVDGEVVEGVTTIEVAVRIPGWSVVLP